MKILFVSSANRYSVNPIVKNQGESLIKPGISVYYFGIRGKGLIGYIKNFFILRKYLKRLNPDLIHAHYSLSGLLAGIASGKIPVVVSLMGSDILSKKRFILLSRWFSIFLWSKVIVKSQAMQSSFPTKKTTVLPNGVDLSVFRPDNNKNKSERETNLQKKEIINVYFLADPLRESKNFQLAESAFDLLDNTKILLNVSYNNQHTEIPALLNRTDILLVTSKWEGSPNIVKEAMACNCPVVSTSVGDVPWLFENLSGYYITTFEAKDVAEKILQAANFVKDVGRTKGRERIIELGLDSNTIAKKLFSIYNSVLEKKK